MNLFGHEPSPTLKKRQTRLGNEQRLLKECSDLMQYMSEDNAIDDWSPHIREQLVNKLMKIIQNFSSINDPL